MKTLWRRWEEFFFAPVPALPVAVFRVLFAINMFLMYLIRLTDWRFYYTDEGIVPAATASEVIPDFFRPPFHWYPHSDGAVFWLQIVLLGALVCLVLGVGSRLAALVAYVLHLAFMQRNLSIVYGADIVSTFFLFSLIFIDSGRRLSVWPSKGKFGALMSSAGWRLVQIQLCVIYGYTGLEKLKGPTWWEGTAVWSVLGNQQIMLVDLGWLKSFPLFVVGMTFSTIVFEVYFPALVWSKAVRKWLLLFGALLHAMIALTVGLVFFSGAMVATYFVFADESWFPRSWRRAG